MSKRLDGSPGTKSRRAGQGIVRVRAIAAPAEALSPLVPASLLEPPPVLPRPTPSVLLDAIAAVMVASKSDQRQLTYGEHRWERTIQHRYQGGIEAKFTISGDARHGLLTPAVVQLMLHILSIWTSERFPERLPVSIGMLADETGFDRREIASYLHVLGSLHITGFAYPPKAQAKQIKLDLNVLSVVTTHEESTRIGSLHVNPDWKESMGAGMRTLIDLSIVRRIEHPLALRLYLFLATECSFGRVKRLSSTVGAEPIVESAFAWHRRLFGYDLDTRSPNSSRFYAAFELALDELASYAIVGPQSVVQRSASKRDAALRTRIAVQPGQGLEVLPLLGASMLGDSELDRHLLIHLVRFGVNAATARELLQASPDVVTRALLQAYYRRDSLHLKPLRSWAAFLVEAIRENREWTTDADATAWAHSLRLEARRPRGIARETKTEVAEQLGAEVLAVADILRAENANGAGRTMLVGQSLAAAIVDGQTIKLDHYDYAGDGLRQLVKRTTEQEKVWQILERTFPSDLLLCVVSIRGQEIARFPKPPGV